MIHGGFGCLPCVFMLLVLLSFSDWVSWVLILILGYIQLDVPIFVCNCGYGHVEVAHASFSINTVMATVHGCGVSLRYDFPDGRLTVS